MIGRSLYRRLVVGLGVSVTATCLTLALLVGAFGCQSEDEYVASKLRVAVIPKATENEYWKAVEAGALAAANEQRAEVIWKGPSREDQVDEQIKLVEELSSQGVAGIVLAPIDSKALVPAVKAARARNVRVVIFDSALDAEVGKDFIAFVGTHNRNAGKMAGEELVRLLGGKGKVVLLRHKKGSASTHEREEGFLEAMVGHPEMKVVSADQYAGGTVESAKQKSKEMLDAIRDADGLFCPNETTTLGTLQALRDAGVLKSEGRKLKFVGFDATPPLVQALDAGEIDALVSQDPDRMGHDAVQTVIESAMGKLSEQVQDTGAVLITKSRMLDPDVRKILKR